MNGHSRATLRSALVLALLGVLASLIGSGHVRATGNLEVAFTSPEEVFNRLWPDSAIPITWFFNTPTAGPPCSYSASDAPIASLQPAVELGFDAWEDDPYSRIDFTYGGTTSTTDVGFDGEPIVTFCDSAILASDPGFLASTPSTAWVGPGPLDVTDGSGGCPAGTGEVDPGPPVGNEFCFPAGSYPPGTMLDADVQYNVFGTNEEAFWSTNGTIGKFEVQDTATHENGHFFGLSHDPTLDATMFAFIDDNPRSDGLGQAVPKISDLATSALYYPDPNFAIDFGSITGTVTLDGFEGDGVHVMAIDPTTLLPVGSRFSISRRQISSSLGPEGPDFGANGGGFYRIEGLPPQDYYVCIEYFNDSDFISGRLANRYNGTVAFSNVEQGSATLPGDLGFKPQLTECFNNEVAGDPNSPDSGDGGNGSLPGFAADNSDAATPVPVSAGSVTGGIDIAINIEPSGPTPASRENPTTRATLPNDGFISGDTITAFLLNGGTDDFWLVKFPATSLPTVPYNVAEGVWARSGITFNPMVNMLTGPDPADPNLPDLSNPILSAGRMVTGGPNGVVAAGDFADVRDQWNVTINTAQDLWVVMNQPESPAGISFLTEGYFNLVTCAPGCPGPGTARVGNTYLTEDGGATISLVVIDVFYDLITERNPPVMITGIDPIAESQIQTISISGFGFLPGATVDLGPDITVHNVTHVSANQLDVLAQAHCTGAVSSRVQNVTVTNPEVIFPNVSRVLTVNPDPGGDADCDGTLDGADCAPADPGVTAAASLVTNLEVTHVGGDTVDISFDNQGLSAGVDTAYDVVTGLATDLIPDGGFASATCATNDLVPAVAFPPVVFTETTADPPGSIRYYNARAANICTVPAGGTYGDSESTIVPDPRDDLDAGVPCAN